MESLYTKYRPQTFEQVVGQKHVVETLMRAVSEHKTSHAYLFCGPRGTGKTTMARLLAKALMCEKGEGLPDGTCEQCRLIAAGEHPDVAELDAASRTGVDNVRDEIISRVNYAPTMGRCKVYIIDEVHMLTTAAFNALLKTLEEPPEHVVFIMCTTDPQKVLPTILSRVQRFDFHSIAPDEMQAHLAYVCGREGFTFDDAALELVVRHARGGMRDALTSLEQLSVFGNGHIGVKAAQDFLGEVSGSVLGTTATALAQRDVPALFAEVEKLVGSGRDLLQFTRELAGHVRDVYVVSVAPDAPGAVSATGEALDALRAEAAAFGSPDRVARVLTVLGDASSEMRTATNQRLVLEIAFTRIARPETDLTVEALADRLAILEQKLERGALAAVPVAGPTAAPGVASTAASQVPTSAAPAPAAPAPFADTSRAAGERRAGNGGAGVSQPAMTSQPAFVQQPAPQPTMAPQPAQQPARPQQPARQPARPQQPVPQPAMAPQPAAAASSAPMAPAALQRAWKQVVDGPLKQSPAKRSLLLSASPVSDDGETLTVGLPAGSGFALKMLERGDVRAVVDPAVLAVFGHRKVVFTEVGAAPKPAAQAPAPQPAAAQRPVAPAAPRPAAPRPAPRPAPATAPAPAPQPVAPQPPEPVYVPDSAYADAPSEAMGADYPMPWDDPAAAASAAPPTPAPVTAPVPAPAPMAQPAAAAAPSTAPSAPASALAPSAAQQPAVSAPVDPADLAPEFSDILAGLTDVFGAPTNVSVEKPVADEDDADVSYDDEGVEADPSDGSEFADEPADDADDE